MLLFHFRCMIQDTAQQLDSVAPTHTSWVAELVAQPVAHPPVPTRAPWLTQLVAQAVTLASVTKSVAQAGVQEAHYMGRSSAAGVLDGAANTYRLTKRHQRCYRWLCQSLLLASRLAPNGNSVRRCSLRVLRAVWFELHHHGQDISSHVWMQQR